MSAQPHDHYRLETERLVGNRGVTGVLLFAGGVGFGSLLEYRYHPERLSYLLIFFALELAVCVVALACYRICRQRRLGVELTGTTCFALLLCVTLYAGTVGLNSAALAFLFIGFELTIALVFPWGTRQQSLLAAACFVLYAVYAEVGVVEAGDGSLPVAYSLYAVAAGGALSGLGAAALGRQRFALFMQRERLGQHLATFGELTRAFRGFDPQRVVLLTCASMLRTFRLARLWITWRTPADGAAHGYLVSVTDGGLSWEPLADLRPLSAWVAGWAPSSEAFVAPADEPELPTCLRGTRVSELLCVPLTFEGEHLGAICGDREGAPLGIREPDLALASVFASGTAVALANAWLYQRVADVSEDKSVFLARIAHELRNPLQALLWDLDSLDAGAHGLILERIRQHALLTVDLTRELQEFAEVETKRLTASPEAINLVETVDNLRAIAMPLLAGRPIEFRVNIDPGAGVVVTDPFRLRQVLGNLISNAAKFTTEGTIDVEAQRVGREIVISVRDTGIGIVEAEQARIFAPFYRCQAQGLQSPRGMGLGLAIAHDLIALLGGRLEVESTIGRGSTFRVVLPAEDQALDEALPPHGGKSRAGDDMLVLVIEDDEHWRAQAGDALRQTGARVLEARDGGHGLRTAHEMHPDVVVLDLGLPDMSGLEVLGRLRADPDLAALPVVIATTDPSFETQCRAHGHVAYLTKPYSADELLRAVDSAMQRGGARPETLPVSSTRDPHLSVPGFIGA